MVMATGIMEKLRELWISGGLHRRSCGSGEYQFPGAPFKLDLEYTFSIADNDRADTSTYNVYSAYTPYAGITNAVSLFITVYPEY